MSETHTIAMWSGPRNLSTAMMRAWENRADTVVWDEPLYAYYLKKTGRPDPMAGEIIDGGISDWAAAVEKLCTPPATGLQYQKHITTHVLPEDSIDWLHQTKGMQHLFLIREPERVAASFDELLDYEAEEEFFTNIGFEQQQRIFDAVVAESANTPIVIDSTRFLANPKKQLKQVCDALSIPFDEAMLNWPAGPRTSDGVWAPHWYASVNSTTGFGKPRTELPSLTEAQTRVANRCRGIYERLLAFAL